MDGSSGLVTILFTDLVGSTELLSRTGDEAAQRIFRAHHDLLAEVANEHGGDEVKWLGDGLMVAFPSAAGAVRAAVSMQSSTRRLVRGEHLAIRVGINAGETLRDAADFFGLPVVVARRLCDRADAGQILCTDVVAGLLSGRPEFSFRDMGKLDLKGVSNAVAAFEVHDAGTAFQSLPARMPFVGREAERARLDQRLAEANRLLAVASTFEGTFRIGIAAAAAELSEMDALDAIDEALAAQLARPGTEADTCAFAHALVRDTIYGELSGPRRLRLHRRVAEALEAAWGPGRSPAQAGEIAAQYHRSSGIPGAERGVEPALEAAAYAESTGANDEAAYFLRIALELMPDNDLRRVHLLGRLGITLAWARRFDEAVPVAAQVGDALADREGPSVAASYLSEVAYACGMVAGSPSAWALAEQGLRYATERDVAWARLVFFDPQRQEAEHRDVPGIPLDTPERAEAARLIRDAPGDPMALYVFEAVFSAGSEARASRNLTIRVSISGDFVASLGPAQEEAERSLARGQLVRAARARSVAAFCLVALGRLQEARASVDDAKAFFTRAGAPMFVALHAEEQLALALDTGWEDVGAAFEPMAGTTGPVVPALAWAAGILYAISGRIDARLGRAELALRRFELLIPWLKRAPAWTVHYPMMASHAVDILCLLGRTDHADVIENALRTKGYRARLPGLHGGRTPGPGPAVRPPGPPRRSPPVVLRGPHRPHGAGCPAAAGHRRFRRGRHGGRLRHIPGPLAGRLRQMGIRADRHARLAPQGERVPRHSVFPVRAVRPRAGTLAGLLLLTAGQAHAAHAAAAPKDTVTIGAALSLTGSLAREGALTREGYDYCAAVVNKKGGIHVGDRTYRLALRYQDDQSTPDTASRLVEQMNSAGIKLLLGPYGSASTEAAAAVVERNGQVMVEGAGADDKIFAKGYRRIFAVLSPASTYLGALLQAAVELYQDKPERVAIISADDGFSKTAAEGGRAEARRLGIEVVGLEYVPNATTDVSSALTRLRPLRPDLVLGSVHLQEGIAIVKQSKELGLNPSGGFGETVAPATPDFVRTLGRSAEGVLGSAQWTPDVPGRDEWFGNAADYAAGFRAKFGREATYHNAEATAACLAMVMAIERADSLEPDKVRDALDALDVDTFFGPIRFDPTGKNTAKPMYVIQIQDGKVVTVWPRGALTQPLRPPAPAPSDIGGTSPGARFAQSTVYGLLQGGLYGLVGVGFSMVWGVTNIVNLSQGALVVGGAYIAWELNATFGLHPLLGMVVAAIVLFGLGYVTQRGLINLVMNAPIFMTLLLTFGLELATVNALVWTLTGDYRSIPTGYATEAFAVGGVRVPYGRLVGFALAIVLTAALAAFLGRTRLGRAIRGTGMDRGAARLMGIPVPHIYAVTFGLAAALAGAAGAVIGTVSTFSPAAAGDFTLRSFVVAVLGGLGNMWGALAGGIVLGVVEAWGGQYLSGTLINAIAFAVLVVVLIVRPAGLLGRPFYEARIEAA